MTADKRFIVIHGTMEEPGFLSSFDDIVASNYRKGVVSGQDSRSAYHLFIDSEAQVHEGRLIEEPARLSGDYGEEAIAICMAGGLTETLEPSPWSYTEAQLQALANLLNRLFVEFPTIQVLGHREADGRAHTKLDCPGFCAATFAATVRACVKGELS